MSISLFRPALAPCADTAILRIVLNGEAKGEFFVKLADGGDVLVRAEDLKAVGFQDPRATIEVFDGETYLSLRAMEGVSFVFDEGALTLAITSAPGLLGTRTIDFRPRRQPNVEYPRDAGGFFNYGLTYVAGNSFAFGSVDAAAELGVRLGDYLFFTDGSYSRTPDEEKWVRSTTSVTYDRRMDLQRVVLGDVFASSGDLGSAITLGGVGVSKVYRIDPYLITYPLADVSGMAALPSDAEIYVDGLRVRTEKLSPGRFELRNISQYGGAGAVTVVLKDPFGREQKYRYPFYFTDALLKRGLHEYSYNAGFLRKEFGVESDRYGPLAFSAFHRFGASDSVNVGLHAEATKGKGNLGPQALFRAGKAGIVSLSLAMSLDGDGRAGGAGLLNYSYQDKAFNARLLLRGESRDYALVSDAGLSDRVRSEAGAGIGYGTRNLGTISIDFDDLRRHQGPGRQTATLGFSRSIRDRLSLLATLRRIREEETAHEFSTSLTYYPWKETSVSAGYKRLDGTDTETVQLQKNQPAGEGVGVRLLAERTDAPAFASSTANPFVQYNARHAVLSGELRGVYFDGGARNETYRLGAAGGIAYVGNTIGFSRPIADSFGLVTVDRLEGVRVSVSNQEIGKTGRKGNVFIPGLSSYYENQVSINDKDVPIEYSLSEVVKYVSPPLRSGSVIRFAARRIRAVTGKLSVRRDGEVRPVEFREIKLGRDGAEIVFPTGRGGEFYVEDLPEGRHRGVFGDEGKSCSFDLVVPGSEEMIVDLGGITCEDVR